jgi:glutamyl-tRNA synthetase
MAYKEMGYIPEALVNYLVRLGWSHGDQEIFSLDELVRIFTLESVGKSAAVFNPEKLLWLNQHYIKECDSARLVREVTPFWQLLGLELNEGQDFLMHVIGNMKTRAKTLVELAESSRFYFDDRFDYDKEAAEKFLKVEFADHLAAVADAIPSLRDYTKEGIEGFLRKTAGERGIHLKVIAQPLRVALTGKVVSPSIDDIILTLGKERVIKRIARAIEYINRKN